MSLTKSKELREERAGLIKDMQAIAEAARTEDRNLSAEEMQKIDELDTEQQDMLSKAEGYERLEKIDSLRSDIRPANVPQARASNRAVTNEDRDLALRGFLLGGTQEFNDSHREAMQRCGMNPNNNRLNFNLNSRQPKDMQSLVREYRGTTGLAQSVGTAGAGGNSVPDETMQAIEVALLSYGGMREACDVIRTGSGADMPIPSSNDTMESGARLGENTQETVNSIDFGQTVMKAFKYSSKIVKVSMELLQDSNVNLPQFIGETLGTRIGRILNTEFTISASTNVANNPQGLDLFSVAATTGAGTASASSVTYGELLTLLHSVDPEYRRSPNFRFMFNDATLKTIKAMVDTQGRPLWVPGVALREPDTILGYPYIVNQDVVSQALNAKFAYVGDFSKYKIRDVKDISLVRLDERYADLAQVGFIALSRHDGRGVNAGTNPIKHLVSGSST